MAAFDLSRITSNPGATPSPSPVEAMNVQTIEGARVNVTLPSTQDTIAMANVTTSGSVSAGKYHIEFILSTDFTGTIGGVTIPSSLGVYPPDDAPPGRSLGSLAYTVTGVSAILTIL